MVDNVSVDKGELVNGLLGKCEAKNLPEVYHKYISKMNDICSIQKLQSFNSYFTPENIKNDLKNDQSCLIISVYDDVLEKIEGIYGKRPIDIDSNGKIINPNKERNGKDISKSTECVVNITGLAKLVLSYKKLKYLTKIISIEKMKEIFNIQSGESAKFKQMIIDLVENRVLYAVWDNNGIDSTNDIDKSTESYEMNENSMILRFTSKFNHPSNKKLVIQLVATIITMIIMLSILSRIIKFGN